MRNRLICLIFLFGFVPSVGFGAPADGHAKQVERLEGEIDRVSQWMSEQLGNVHSHSLEDRLADGIVMQATGDHERASYILMDIVSREQWRGLPGFQTAQLLLARSLYECGYYRLSQGHLLDLIKHGSGSERMEGVSLLLQVAQRTGDWEAVNAAIEAMGDAQTNPAHRYILGRALLLQGDKMGARSYLRGIPVGDEWGAKSAYLLGVLAVEEGALEEALGYFEAVLRETLSYRRSEDVRSLALLAKARIFYEQGRWSEAMDVYQLIPDLSPYFGDVLYELAWTSIRAEEYEIAKQYFELLLLTYPKHRRAMDTRRLLADLQRELGRYEDALTSYQQIVGEFEPIMLRMESDAESMADRKAHIVSKVASGSLNAVEIIPDSVRGMVSVSGDVLKVETMLTGLGQTELNTTESSAIIAEIQAILDSPIGVYTLPEFRRFTDSLRDIRIGALVLGAGVTRRFESMDASTLALVDEVSQLPRTQHERDVMQTQQIAAREEREARLHRLRLEAEGMRHRIRIIRSWLDGSQGAAFGPDERAQLFSQLDVLEARLANLGRQQSGIETQLSIIRSMGPESVQERSAAQRNLNDLREVLSSHWRGALSGGSGTDEYRQLIGRIEQILSRVDQLEKR
ncbi:MAG: tetratricopeptide repeat protein, partial [Proteobacteria bacterium]|nr:tetratricopeptide repeat protein [Pseudomonadota bacterium]